MHISRIGLYLTHMYMIFKQSQNLKILEIQT